MKVHTKKKLYRASPKALAVAGYINRQDGTMIQRSQAVDNAMKRDYSPQAGK